MFIAKNYLIHKVKSLVEEDTGEKGYNKVCFLLRSSKGNEEG